VAKVRLDTLLAERGLFESRTRAAASVMAGEVLIGADRQRASKPGQMVPDDVVVDVRVEREFVSRGGIKLANALDALGVPVEGRDALDVGASTGGFTDCLLQRGARHVVAVDVAYGELHWRLRGDARVTVVERCNARSLRPDLLPYAAQIVTLDLSFISLTKVLEPVLACTAPEHDVLAMVKPQFEAGRDAVGKGGVVRDEAVRRAAVRGVAEHARELGASVLGFAPSGLPGPRGNVETFIWLGEAGRAGAIDDLDAALEGVAV
jgi:23S rRNA (cytidine1920-2'-O)/16S rRNA (cytidine1409-2'-O)-methyltransferase